METSNVDTVLFGRVTYQQFESFWPHAAEDPATPPELRVFADALNKMVKVVFSTTLKRVTWKNSKLLHEIVPGEIERMKQGPGGDMIIFGSASVAQKLTDHSLIDEYQFIVNPVLLGRGKSLLSDSKLRTNLELVQAKPGKSGNVLLRYAPKKRDVGPSTPPHLTRDYLSI